MEFSEFFVTFKTKILQNYVDYEIKQYSCFFLDGNAGEGKVIFLGS